MGAGENPGPVNDIIHTGGNAGRNAFGVFHGYDRLDQALAFCQKLDELFIDTVDLLAEVGDAWLFHC